MATIGISSEKWKRYNTIHEDFRSPLVNNEIADGSVDLIFTDPPYLKEYVEIYGDLGEFASRKLRNGGCLVCYIGHYNLPDYIRLLGQHLNYWWIFAMRLQRPGFPMNNKKIVPKFKPILMYVKGEYTGEYIYDHIDSTYQDKKLHKWQQSTIEAKHFISRLTHDCDLICDPFMGSGTTGVASIELGRRFVGVEINKKHHEDAVDRLSGCMRQAKLAFA